MTSCYNQLQAGPQTAVDISQLSAEERILVRQIQINGTKGVTASESVGGFTGVFYIAGDEKRAAKQFVAENRPALNAVDFSHRDPISTSVSRTVYDWILHFLGERTLEKHETVVIERRPDGTVWCIARRIFEETPLRRYTESGTGSARIDEGGLTRVYESHGELITESTLRAESMVAGDVREILDAFRQSSEFSCEPTTVDGELAVKSND